MNRCDTNLTYFVLQHQQIHEKKNHICQIPCRRILLVSSVCLGGSDISVPIQTQNLTKYSIQGTLQGQFAHCGAAIYFPIGNALIGQFDFEH